MLIRVLSKILRYRDKKEYFIADDCSVKKSSIGRYSNFAHHAEVIDSTIGDRTSIGRYTKIRLSDIGKYCSISWDVTIGAVSHPIKSVSMHAFSFRKKFGLCNEDVFLDHKRVKIGNDVWIGCGAVIMSGIRIGNGAIIGAGAVVTHDVDDYEVVGGVPAKHIRYRFSEEVRRRLNSIRWWDFSDEIIKNNIQLFHFNNDIEDDDSILQELERIKNEDSSSYTC